MVLFVPKKTLPHLVCANETEIAHLEKAYEECGDDWPDWFDANDVYLHEIVRTELRSAQLGTSDPIQFRDWKGMWFLLRLIPQYIEKMGADISLEDVAALMDVYNQKKLRSAT